METAVWTVALVLDMFDAGVAEVIALHNRNVTNIWTHVVPGRTKTTGIAAYVHREAMEQTVATLNAAESILLDYEAWVEDMYVFAPDDHSLDTWELVDEFPANLGIERMPMPMFTAIVA